MASRTINLTGENIVGGNGLATHPTTGELWALLRLIGQEGRELVTLNPATGMATRIGDTGDRFAGLAFDNTGTLYGFTDRGANIPESLFILSQTNATWSFVTSLVDGEDGEAIAFNPADGLLYHASGGLNFESIDPNGPTSTHIATCTSFSRAAALTYLGADVLLLAESNRVLSGITTTGGLTRIGALDHRSKGLAFADLPIADLSLFSSAAPDPVNVGETLTYTLTLINDGPDDFPDAMIFDALPGTVGLVSAIPSQGTCDTQTCGGLACSLGDLEVGASATVAIDVTPLAAGSITNTAIAPDINDPDPSNNEAAEVTAVLPGVATSALLSIDGSAARLRSIDPGDGTTLASRTITLDGEEIIGGNGLATHPTTGELWALLRLSGQEGRELVTLNPATGVATRIGDTGDLFAGLAFDNDGTLYGITGEGALTPESLFILSQSNGTRTLLFSLANGAGGETIAFQPADGLLYHASDGLTFESIDLNRSTIEHIATCTNVSNFRAAALTYLGRDVLLLAERDNGLYGITTAGGLAHIGSLDHRSKGLAFLSTFLFADGFESGDTSAWSTTIGGR